MAKAGMTNPLGARLMIHSMKKQFKNFDKDIQITKIKEKEVK
jgi:cellobiose-specific phosphotransferase system component IIB